MLRIVLEAGLLYTLFRWGVVLCDSIKLRMHWVSNVAMMAVLTLAALGVVLPIGYEFDLTKLVFESSVSTAWLVVDTMEISFFFMVCEYFERQIARAKDANQK